MAAWPHGRKINLLFILQSKSSFAGFLVERRQIMPSTLHHLHHMIEGDTMVAVGSDGIECGIGSACGSKGITLNAGNLNQSADGVTGHAKMMLQSHLCSILYLVGTTSP